MGHALPAISGPELAELMMKDGWVSVRKSKHGTALTKDGRLAIIPTKSNRSLPRRTLLGILSQKQSGIGRAGLARVIELYR